MPDEPRRVRTQAERDADGTAWRATAAEKRVILIKPGDVLLIGGVRFADPEHGAETIRRFRELTGISPAVFFADDIQIDALTAEQIAALAAREEPA